MNASVSTVSDNGIDGGSGNDTITLGTGAVISGNINCGGDTDTLEFAMTVSSSDLASVQAAIAAADPAGDNLTISGENYTWVECEALQDSVTESSEPPVAVSTPIPTLAEWAIITLIFLLGFIGIVAVRRTA